MARNPQTSVKLDPPAAEALAELQQRVRREQGLKASREDIIGALAYGTPPAQLVWMLPAFIKHSTAAGNEEDASEAAESGG
jgi:hypothetical protein